MRVFTDTFDSHIPHQKIYLTFITPPEYNKFLEGPFANLPDRRTRRFDQENTVSNLISKTPKHFTLDQVACGFTSPLLTFFPRVSKRTEYIYFRKV